MVEMNQDNDLSVCCSIKFKLIQGSEQMLMHNKYHAMV